MKDRQKTRSEIQEDLLSLYLRLNGYFVTGFIVHSPVHGRNSTQIDALAVRFPYNKEPERQVPNSNYLDPSDELTDLIICEVKSSGQKLQFNNSLRSNHDIMAGILRWAGLFIEDEILDITRSLQAQIQPRDPPNPSIATVLGPRNTRIRAMMCSPERANRRPNQAWFIHGSEIFDFIWQCFRPDTPRDMCATTYDFTSWGGQYEPIVQYFKNRKQNNPGNMDDLYTHLNV